MQKLELEMKALERGQEMLKEGTVCNIYINTFNLPSYYVY